MPIVTNLGASPYFDDFDVKKDYYRILFKPSTSVQVRELNQFQSIFQNQIEKFGDNIFRKGTIVDGCSFVFDNNVPYVKLVDLETDSTPVVPSIYVGNFVKNQANLTGVIIKHQDGFEATDPDLKTIYVKFTNSGTDQNQAHYSSGETLTIYSPTSGIYKVDIVNGGSGFSNSDIVIFTPQISITETSGQYQVGNFVVDNVTAANLQIESIDRASLASSGKVILKLKPRDEDLTSSSSNSEFWTIQLNSQITDPSGSVSATVDQIFGESATAKITTLSDGSVSSVDMTDRGRNYAYLPSVNIKSPANPSGVSTLDLSPRNYIAQVKVSSAVNSTGFGYMFSVGEGTVYQKGHFLRVTPQSIIVSKYNPQPNNVAVGFFTEEEIVNYNQDTTLLDNALGTENETAPGADRLKLTPVLDLVDKDTAAANAEFFTLVEWNDGNPYKQNQTTVYNRIGDEIAKANYDSAGNFVLDSFQVITSSTANTSFEGKYYTVIVDPGQAYIGGIKVQTTSNYKIDLDKGIDTKTSNNTISLNYGNYVKVKEIGGTFLFNVGDTVKLYSQSKGYVSNTSLVSSANTSPQGRQIGTAKMRSMIYDEGRPGSANTTYKLYLFDIKINPGENFDSVRSVYYDGTNKGIADVVTENQLVSTPTTNSTGGYVASGVVKTVVPLYGKKDNKLLFRSGFDSIKNSNSTNYIYRTVFTDTAVANSTGVLQKTISTTNEFFPYSGNLTNSQKLELYVVPTEADLIQYDQLSGTISVNTTSNLVSGSSTDFFVNFEEGDYIYAYSNAASKEYKKITKILSSNSIQVDSAFSFANTSAIHKKVFPKNVQVPFGTKDGLDASVTSNTILTLNFKHANGDPITFEGTGSFDVTLGVNIQRKNVTSSTKTANRNKFVKISLANNVSGVKGPWCIGVPDAFRLRNVWVGNSSVSNTSPNLTQNFYIDHNQNANYLGLGYLYTKPNSRINLTSADHLLVEFDYYTRNENGYFDTVSYLHSANADQIFETNSKSLSELASESNSFEVPEVYTFDDNYYDLLNTIDFRPAIANTVAPAAVAASAPVNPSETETFDTVIDKKFPYPDSTCITQLEYYMGRMDDVYIGQEGNIYVLKGIPDINPRKRFTSNHPKDSLKLQTLSIPPYPNIPQILSNRVAEITNTRIGNEKKLNLRLPSRIINPLMTTSSMQHSQPIVYTMEDIGNLERRIKDLEYYVSLSLLETNITNKVIPSSIDGTVNRFKFGFFADDFSTQIYSDLDNPQYSADIEIEGDLTYGSFRSPLDQKDQANDPNKYTPGSTPYPSQDLQKETNRLVPSKYIWSVNHIIGQNVPYVDHLFLEQKNATYEVNVVSNCVPKYVEVTNTTIKLSNAIYYTTQANGLFNTSGKTLYPKVDKITMGSLSGQATLYFVNYGAIDRISIYQGNTLVAGTHKTLNVVQNMTNSDISFLSSNTQTSPFYKITNGLGFNPSQTGKSFIRGSGTTTVGNTVINFADFVKYDGKITFNHDPSKGTEYAIQVDKGTGSGYWKWLLVYPTTQTSTNTVIIDVANCVIVNPPTGYTGTMTVRGIQAWSCSNQFRVNISEDTYTAFVVDATGLKPSTKHNFFVDGVKAYAEEGFSGNYDNGKIITDPNGRPDYSTYVVNAASNSAAYSSIFVAPRTVGAATTGGLNAPGFAYSQKTLGKPLITNSSGKLSFSVYVPLKEVSWVMGSLGLTGGIYKSDSKGGKGTTYGSSGYSKFEIIEAVSGNTSPSSYASLVVANRTPDKAIPNATGGSV